MEEPRHIIQKQNLVIHTSDRESAQKLQDEISRIFNLRIRPLLEARFNELAPDERVVRLDHLDLDLGRIDPAHFEEQIMVRVQEQLARLELPEAGFEPDLPGFSRVVPDTETGSEDGQVGENRALALLLHYWERGSLPWWVRENERKSVGKLAEKVWEETPGELVRAVHSRARDAIFRERMIFQSPHLILEGILKALLKQQGMGSAAAMLIDAVLLMREAVPIFSRKTGISSHRWQIWLWGTAFEMAGGTGGATPSFEDCLHLWMEKLPSRLPLRGAALQAFIVELWQPAMSGASQKAMKKYLQGEKFADFQRRFLSADEGLSPKSQSSEENPAEQNLPEESVTQDSVPGESADGKVEENVSLDAKTNEDLSEARDAGQREVVSPDGKKTSGEDREDSGDSAFKGEPEAPEMLDHLPEDASEPVEDQLFRETTDPDPDPKTIKPASGDAPSEAPAIEKHGPQQVESSEQSLPESDGKPDEPAPRDLKTPQDKEGKSIDQQGSEQERQSAKYVEQGETEVDPSWQPPATQPESQLEEGKSLTREKGALPAKNAGKRGEESDGEGLPPAEIDPVAEEDDAEAEAAALRLRWDEFRKNQDRKSSSDRSAVGEESAGGADELDSKPPAEKGDGQQPRSEDWAKSWRRRRALQPGESLYLRNAGLVLFWPYLRIFFESRGLMQDGQFLDQEAQYRAVHLLQFVATGTPESDDEFELALNKLLSGLPISEPVPELPPITEEEQAACVELIEAVVRNWSVIGQMSPDGFRGTYLLREGRLSLVDHGYELHIERKAFDIFLDRLPWGIGTIQLDWLPEMLYVYW
jgi:hypothetical protein